MKMHHFAIKVKNIDISINFYVEKLGFKIHSPKQTTDDGLYSFSYLDLKGSLLEIVQCNDGKEIKDNTLFPHIGFESDDLEKDLKSLKSEGIKILEGPYIDLNNVKIITFADPDGYRIDIGQILKKK